MCVCVCVCPANSVYNNIFLLLYPCLRFSDLRNNVLQLGDSRFEPLERVRYTRDQLLEMREVHIHSVHFSCLFHYVKVTPDTPLLCDQTSTS
jgi:hypothetical protein